MPDAVVIKVEKKAEKNALIHFDVGEVAWSPDYEVASKLLIGKPLPDGWTVKAGEYGPQAFPPRPKGSAPQAAWRNTKEGFLAEAQGRLRWQHVEEERRDRRTALMQAVALVVSLPLGERISLADDADKLGEDIITTQADELYTWVRQTSGTPSGESASASHLPVSQAGGVPESTSEKPSAYGEGAAAPSAETDPGGQDSSPQGTVDLATADDLANAAKHGLTPTKAKAIAASLGITVTKPTELTREQLAAVINRYLEVKK